MAWYNAPLRWPFGKEVKTSLGGASVFFQATVENPFGMDTYTAFAFEGYKRNSTANACINLIWRAIADLPIKVFREVIVGGKVEEVPADDHPVWKLIGQSGRPNQDQSWGQFNAQYWIYKYIDGNDYLWALGTENLPVSLILLRPDRVTPELSNDRKSIVGYRYSVSSELGDGRVIIIPFEEVLHTKQFNPLSDLKGMPILEACATEIDQDNAAGTWNYSLLKNGGRPSLFLKAPEGMTEPDPAQIKMLKEWLRQNVTGPGNAGLPLIMPGVDITEVGKNAKEMDWIKGMIQAKVAIANVCGVPPELIGIQDQKTYSNYQEARKAFYEETVIPLADDFFRSLTRFLGSRTFGNVRPQAPVIIAVDKEKVKALQESQDALHGRARDDIKGGLFTNNEGRGTIGMEPVEGGDTVFVPANMIPIELAAGTEVDEVMPGMEPIPIEEETEEEENEG